MFVPIVATISLAVDVLAVLTNNFAPVTGLFAHACMAEARRFTLARVVATPVQEYDAQPEPAFVVVELLRVVLGLPSSLPEQQVIRDGVHDCAQAGCFVLHTYEHGAFGVVLSVVARYEGC